MILQGETKGSVALWRAVIAQAIDDATRYVAAGSKSTGTKLHVSDARAWFMSPNMNFNYVCALADLEPSQVRALAVKRIAEAEAKMPELKAKHEAHSQRVARGHASRRAKIVSSQSCTPGVVANFPESTTDRTLSTAQETT